MIDINKVGRGSRSVLPFVHTVYNYTALAQPKTVFEIGSGRYAFSQAILAALEKTGGHLFTCDPKPKIQYHHPQMTFMLATSNQVAQNWRKPIHLLMIDGDHTYPQVKQDCHNFFPYVTSEGLIIFHDINVGSAPGVKKLWNEIKPHHKILAELLDWPGLGVIRK
ncbi:hypothetical protein ES703_94751 [subsurface metagenome]